jgi:hypothetical protein
MVGWLAGGDGNHVLCGVDGMGSVETVIDGHTENTVLVLLHCLGSSVFLKLIVVR